MMARIGLINGVRLTANKGGENGFWKRRSAVAPRCAVANHHFVGAVHASLTGDVGHHVAERESTARIVIERQNLEAEMKAFIGCAAIIFAWAPVRQAEEKAVLKALPSVASQAILLDT